MRETGDADGEGDERSELNEPSEPDGPSDPRERDDRGDADELADGQGDRVAHLLAGGGEDGHGGKAHQRQLL